MLARARRLDRSVQREQVGLACDPCDGIHQLADLARALLQRAGGPGDLVEVIHQGHQQLAGAGDLVAVSLGLVRYRGDPALRVLRARVELGRHIRGRLRVVAPVADQLTLARRSFGQPLRGRRDLLRCRLELLRRRRELLRQARQVVRLLLDLLHHAPDRRSGAIHADAEKAKVVELLILHRDGQVSLLHSGQRGSGGAQPPGEPRQGRDQHGGHKGEHHRLLRERAPRPSGRPLAHADGGGQAEAREVEQERLPRFHRAEVEPSLQWGNQVGHVQQMPGRAHGVQDR